MPPAVVLGDSNGSEKVYYVHEKLQVECSPEPGTPPNERCLEPVVVALIRDPAQLTAVNLVALLDQYLREDDVICVEFFRHVLINVAEGMNDAHSSSPDWAIPGDALSLLGHKYGTKEISFLSGTSRSTELLQGPYFSGRKGLYQAWRVYKDTYEAFVLGTMVDPYNKDVHVPTQVMLPPSHYTGDILVTVPSRLYFPPPSQEKPLSGCRVALKDIAHLRGIRTAASSRALNQLYPPCDRSAPCVQKLLDLGAIIVGKVKTSQFADVESPTADWVDVHCPFNPRGDGYLTPCYSSSGSGAAIAGYEWLDVAIGTDTGGSVRGPCASQGVFGNRSSTGAIDMTGVLPTSVHFDTIGILCRDAALLHTFITAWYQENTSMVAYQKISNHRTRLLYPSDYFPVKDARLQAMYSTFIQNFAEFLKTNATPINLAKIWLQDDPSKTGMPIDEYLDTTFCSIAHFDSYRNHAGFRDDYQAMFGKPPYMNPVLQKKWEDGAKMEESNYYQALRQMHTHGEWMRKILSVDEENGLSAILVVPQNTSGEPEYRDNYPKGPQSDNWGLLSGFHSVFAQLPEHVIPIGQIKYYSKVTDRDEYMPVSVSLVAPRNTDLLLSRLIKEFLQATGMPISVKVGPVCF